MSRTVLELAYQLTQTSEPFVLATVVWCERPTSAKPGAQVIIRSDGQLTGWIGGNCAQPVVVREAIRALQEGCSPFLLRLGSPSHDPDIARSDVRIFPMTCTSGGALDIYMEPHLPQQQLLLIGESPVIAALSQLAPILDFAVTRFDHAGLHEISVNERTCILIATHGQYDEDALEQALASPAAYIGMVCSQRRAASCRAYLRSSGLTELQIARLQAPAGLDIGAVTPEEIAASILATLVQVRRHRTTPGQAEPSTTTRRQENPVGSTHLVLPETAIDIVCGMVVEKASARHHLSYDGREFFFCCPACKRLFEHNPQEYLARNER